MTEFNSDQTETIKITGFGMGEAFSSNIAKIRAQSNAYSNLAEQISGRKFVYQKENSTTIFKSSFKSKLSGTKEVNTIQIGENKCLMIVEADLTPPKIDTANSWFLETEYSDQNLEKSLNEKYQQAVQQVIAKNFPQKDRIEGKLFLNNIDVNYNDSSQQFSISMKVIVMVKG